MKETVFAKLVNLVGSVNGKIVFMSMKSKSKGLMTTDTADGNVKIGLRIGMSLEEYIDTLAHELAHYFLHYDKGDTISSEKHDEYEEQADRAAKMLLAALEALEANEKMAQHVKGGVA